MTITSPQAAAAYTLHNKDKDKNANNKEDSKGLNFKDLNSHFDNKLDASNMNNMVGKNGEEQLKFAQQLLLKQLQCQTPDNAFDPNQMLETMMGMLNIAQNGELVNMQKQGMELQKALFYTSLSAFRGEVVEHSGNEFDYMDQDQEIVVNLPAKTHKNNASKRSSLTLNQVEIHSYGMASQTMVKMHPKECTQRL